MTTDFLHGVEVIDIDSGAKPIRTVKSGVIGVIGTAPQSRGEQFAQLVVGDVESNNAIEFVAAGAGPVFNQYAVRFAHPGEASAPLAVSYYNESIGVVLLVTLATDEDGIVTSTAEDVVNALNAIEALEDYMTVAYHAESDGSGLVEPFNTRYLSGGEDEAFPVNTPVLIAGNRRLAAKLGDSGTLPSALDGIFDQAGAVVVVVRVAEGMDEAATLTNIIGGVGEDDSYTGVHAFLGAESALDVVPRILCAPGFSSELAVAQEMIVVANRLRAHCVIEGPDTTDAAAKAYRHSFGSRRAYVVDPGVTVYEAGYNVPRGNSARVAGLIARIDNEKGFWHSPSNNEIYGIVGTTRPIDFTLGDSSARANLLNESEVATIIRKDGFRLWGNRTCSTEIRYAFLSVSRTADMIDDSILRAHMWAVDRNITAQYIESVVDGVNAYLNTLKTMGAIIDGVCWADPDLNTPENIANGQVYFDFDFAPPYPAERVSFRRRINNDYLEELV